MSLSSSTNTASTGKSTQTFITALVLNVAIAAVEVGIFMLIRNRFRKIYSPRTYLVPPKKRVNALPHSLVGWIPAILRADAKEIISKNGLDAYMFVRFLYLMMEIFLPFMAVTWVILIPVDIANSGGSNTGIERLTFGNVGLSQQPRYAAHLIVVYILTFYVLYLIKRESAAYVILRQDFLTSVEHSRLAQSKTVLVTGVAKEYLNTESLTKFCSIFKGGVARIWIARTLGDLPESFDRLNVATARLEGATTGILKSASQVIAKNAKAKPKKHNAELNAPTEQDVNQDPALIKKFVDGKNRPHHKLGFLGLFGKKVDSIDWSREQIATSNEELRVGREILAGPEADATYPAESAAFIQFNNQMDAHMFAQCLAHHAPLRMSARYLEVAQEDVIWSNLSISPLQAKGRYAISWAMTIGLIVLWSIPVAFVGLLSNVSALCVSAPWLAWLCKLPTPINGIIQGALPPILLAVLFILLPIILRLFARFQGIPLKTLIELSLMTRFFLFLVIHGFLIITLASGLVNAIPQIANNPSSAVTLLATKLPAASTFFLTYFVTVSLGGAAGALLQIVPLIVYYVKLYILGSTPRSVFGIKYNMGSVAWGTLFPNMTLLTVIGLTYSVIAPLVSGFAFLAFALFWFVYKYLFLYVYDLPPSQETGGLFYPKALGHIFVGLYIEQLCLAGLFFLAQDANKKQSALGEGILMVLLIIITILFQITLGSGYGPLYDYLPLSMSSQIDSIQSGPNTPDLDASTRASNEEKKDRGTFPPPSQRPEDIEALNGHGKDSNSNVDHEEHTDANHLSVHAFDHPATYVTQTTIWVPEDTHGFYKGQVAAIQAEKIKVSTQAAYMNPSGKVDVSRSPPDDEWDDSQTL